MAVLGVPGGAEILVILGIVFLLFGPYLIIGWLSYRAGVAKGRTEASTAGVDAAASEADVPPEAIESEDDTRD